NQNLESSMTIIAENGSVKIGGQYMDRVEYCHVKDHEMPELEPTNLGNDYGAYKGSAQNHNYVIDNVVDVLQGKATITTNARVEYCHGKDYEMPELEPTSPGNDYGAYKGSAQNHNYVTDNVVDALQGKATITTTALEGVKVVGIIERIYAANS